MQITMPHEHELEEAMPARGAHVAESGALQEGSPDPSE